MIKHSISFLLLNFLLVTLAAQTPEHIQIHFDKPYYVAGEDAWYKLYFQTEAASIESKVVRVEWLAPNGSIVLQQQLKIIDNYAVGDVAIPYNWQEGNYLFRAYTLWNLNFGEATVFQRVIPIYNLEETPKIAERKSGLADTIATVKTESPLKISLSTNQSSYNRRNEVALTIKVMDKTGKPVSGQFSVSVLDGNYFEEKTLQKEPNYLYQQSRIVNSFSGQYEAEKSLQLRGTLKNGKSELIDTRFLSLFYPKQGIFKQTTVSKGQLNLPIADFVGTQPIQVFDMNPFHEPIPKVTLTTTKLTTPFVSMPLVRSESVANYLFLLSKYRQYREAFKLENPDYGVVERLAVTKWNPDHAYSMEKYKGLSDLASFAREIISYGRVINEKGNKSIRLRYAEKRIFNRLSPWYLVNGWLTDDEPTVLKMPFREIERLEIFNSKKQIVSQLDVSMVSRGLIAITTKDGKTPSAFIKKPNNQEITGFYPIRQFPIIQEQVKNSPDFRPLIFWQPIVQTDENGKATISFTTSDAIGKGQIRVVGMDKQGNMGWQMLDYEIVF